MTTPKEFLDDSYEKTENYLGFKRDKVKPVAKELNQLLCNYHLYYQNLRNFHWNISGENFFDLHNQFEALYNDARLKIDAIAERMLTLRFRPMSKMSEYLKYSKVKEAPVLEEDREMVLTVLQNHKVLIENMREILDKAGEEGDEGTIDMIGGFLENIEKVSWMLDAWASRKRKAVPA